MKERKIYVASSWRNDYQQDVVAALRDVGHQVYDFKHPKEAEHGFSWSAIDPNWKSWTPAQLKEALRHPISQAGHKLDHDAIEWADTGVIVLPSGPSAHLEIGLLAGQKKLSCVYAPAIREADLMYLSLAAGQERINADMFCLSMQEVLDYLNDH